MAGHAMLDLGRTDLVRVMARDAVTRQTTTGKLAEIDDQATVNCAANAEAVRWVADADNDQVLAAAFDRPGTSVEAQSFFLLASCAAQRLERL